MPTWEDVRRIALALPGAEESTSYRQPCFKVNGRPFINVSREPGAISTRASDEEIDLLIAARPDVYFVTFTTAAGRRCWCGWTPSTSRSSPAGSRSPGT